MKEHEFMLALLVYSHMSLARFFKNIKESDDRGMFLFSTHFTYAVVLNSIILPEFI